MSDRATRIARQKRRRSRRVLAVAFACLALLQPVFGGLGQALATADAQTPGLSAYIEICTALGVRVVRLADLPQEGGAEETPDPAGAFCPGCLTATSFAIFDPVIADPVFYEPETAAPSRPETAVLPSPIFTGDINARAPPRLA